ncbi:MAG: TcfC E-set like domain-containing protein [Plesiomonas sp.]|uniref:TcfC E-set like domain-containing protein n=1 Tax=Plesiomonas sp. TaxID=2486279 RepID=UPI003F40B307
MFLPFAATRNILVIVGISVGVTLCSAPLYVFGQTTDPDISNENLLISGSIKTILEAGIALPVTIINKDATTHDENEIVIGYVDTRLQNDRLIIDRFSKNEELSSFQLSDSVMAGLYALKSAEFTQSGTLTVADQATLTFDLLRMSVAITLNEQGFAVDHIAKPTVLPAASSHDLSGLVNYTLNTTHSSGDGGASNYGYLGLNSTQAWEENHLFLDGSSAYSADSGTDFSLDRAVFERDIGGHYASFGMMNGWQSQDLGLVSTLSSDRMYAFAYGNNGRSQQRDTSQSLSPITLYFPSAGEARIYRDDRLLKVIQMPMGIHEVDTAALPSGLYQVKIEVVVAGKIISTTNQQIEKTQSAFSDSSKPTWQFWGGISQRDARTSFNESDLLISPDSPLIEGGSKPVGGVSLSGRAFGSNLATSVYLNRDTWVEEASVSKQFLGGFDVNLGNMQASDGSRNVTASVGAPLPFGLGSIRLAKETGHQGKRLDYWFDNRTSVNTYINMGKLIDGAGQLNVNYSKSGDYQDEERQLSWDYSQHLYSGHYGAAWLNVGVNKQTSHSYGVSSHQKDSFISLSFSMPLVADIQMGYSRNSDADSLDLSVGKSLEDSPITYVGGTFNHSMSDSGSSNYYNAYANFNARYATGTVSASGGQGNMSTSVSLNGSAGWDLGKGVAFGHDSGEAGILIDLPKGSGHALSAVVNQHQYPLVEGHNFLSLPAYQEYTVEVSDNESGEVTFDTTEATKQVTLYPGNVTYFKPNFKQLITVFGRLSNAKGEPMAGINLRNHIGTARTNADGSFSIDINVAHPEILADNGKQDFEIDIKLQNPKATLLLGDVRWKGESHIILSQ